MDDAYRLAFKLYCQVSLLIEENKEEFTLPIEFPDGTAAVIHFKLEEVQPAQKEKRIRLVGNNDD